MEFRQIFLSFIIGGVALKSITAAVRKTLRPIKVAVVDMGGVLFSDGGTEAIKHLQESHGYDTKITTRIVRGKDKKQLSRGKITDEQFWSAHAITLPQGYDINVIKRAWYDGYVLDEKVLEVVKGLKKNKYHLVLFTGNIQSRVEYIENRYKFLYLFDECVYSYEEGYGKTQPEFHRSMLDRVRLKFNASAQEVVLLDDKADLAQPSRDAGVNVVIYTKDKPGSDFNHLCSELARLGVNWR